MTKDGSNEVTIITEKGKKATSRYHGVSKCAKSKKFVAQYKYRGKTKYIGIFTDEVKAAHAYDKAIYKLKTQCFSPIERSYYSCSYRYNFGEPSDSISAESNTDDVEKVHVSGITWYNRRKCWKASLQINKHKYYIGRFDNYADAVQKYLSTLKQFHVQFPDNQRIAIKIIEIESAIASNSLHYKQPGETRINKSDQSQTQVIAPLPEAAVLPNNQQENIMLDIDGLDSDVLAWIAQNEDALTNSNQNALLFSRPNSQNSIPNTLSFDDDLQFEIPFAEDTPMNNYLLII